MQRDARRYSKKFIEKLHLRLFPLRLHIPFDYDEGSGELEDEIYPEFTFFGEMRGCSLFPGCALWDVTHLHSVRDLEADGRG